MEENSFFVLIAILFASQFLGGSSLGRKQRIGYSLIGGASILIILAINLMVPQGSIFRDDFNSFGLLLVPIIFGGQLLALPILQKKAGSVLMATTDVEQESRRWSLLLLIPILFLLLASIIIPIRITYLGGESVYDSQLFADMAPIWISCLIWITGILIWVFSKAEFREQGILKATQFINWRDFVLYSWYKIDNQWRLLLETKYKTGYPTVFFVEEEKQTEIEEFLKRKAIPKQAS